MNTKVSIKQPDYKSIRKESHYRDCTITEADFNTSRPNPHRIAYAVSDINRYYKGSLGGEHYVIKY